MKIVYARCLYNYIVLLYDQLTCVQLTSVGGGVGQGSIIQILKI